MKLYKNIKDEYETQDPEDKKQLQMIPMKIAQLSQLMSNFSEVEHMMCQQQNRMISSTLNIDFARLCQSEAFVLIVNEVKLVPDKSDMEEKDVTYANMKQLLIGLGGKKSDLEDLKKMYPKKSDFQAAMSDFLLAAKENKSPYIKDLIKVMSASCQQLMFPATSVVRDTVGNILNHGKIEQVKESRKVVVDITINNFAQIMYLEQKFSLKGESKKNFGKATPTIIHTSVILKKNLEEVNSDWLSAKMKFLCSEGSNAKACQEKLLKRSH